MARRKTQTEDVDHRFEVKPGDLKSCNGCGYGLLAWACSKRGQFYLATVYPQPDGTLMCNPAHLHFSRACVAKMAAKDAGYLPMLAMIED